MPTPRKILIIAAHPDDEILGCGGTMARHSDQGDDVAVIFMTNGVGARGQGQDTSQDPSLRSSALDQALDIVGARLLAHLSWPDNEMDTISLLKIAQSLEPLLADFQPDLIYTHHGGDLNLDHRLTMQAVLTAARPQPGSSVKAIYSFEVASSTAWQGSSLHSAFQPQHYVSIEAQLERKLAALEAYHEEMRPFPHARSVEALAHLARFRGSQIGFQAAEAFAVERSLVF
ncbi:PIG-L family deacetylase [Verrucomicrobiaceae bacterium 227]